MTPEELMRLASLLRALGDKVYDEQLYGDASNLYHAAGRVAQLARAKESQATARAEAS